MVDEYRKSREWSDKFIPAIKQIVGQHLLTESSFEEDTQQVCDLIILKARDMRIAARVRDNFYLEKYSDEFTIRDKTKYDHSTEINKIIDGWGDWMFYGFANKEEEAIAKWYLLDLNVFRNDRETRKEEVITGRKNNFDGTGFRWFKVNSFSNDFVIAQGA